MKGSHNLSIDAKVTKNVGGANCQIITNNFFATSQNDEVNNTNFANHDN
jgi:hypothetical protein